MKKIFTPLAIAVISCSANAQSLSSGLLMRFNFAGNAKDAGPYALATSPSALTLSADALGKTAQAYSFNGTSDKITVAYNANVQAQFPMTIAAWINMDDSSKAFPIFSNDMSATVYSGASMTVSGAKLSGSIGNGNGVGAQFRSTYESPTLLRSKTWYHVCCVFKGLGIFELYVNGVKVNGSYSGTASSMAYTNSGAAIGINYSRSASPHQYAKGKIDNVMYYGRELSELEINLIKDMVLMSEMDATADFGPYENTPTANSLSAAKDRFGNNGKAIFFNGQTSQWTYANNSTYKLNFPFTMGAWVKLDSNNGNRPVFNLSDHINSKYAGAQMVIQGGIPYLNIGDNNGAGIQFRKSYQVNDSIKVGNWYFIVANFLSLNSFKIYINGVEKTAGTVSGSGTAMAYSNAPGYMGYSSNAFGGGYYFAGAMDGSFLLNGTLNANNISLMFTPGIYFDQNPSNVNALLNTAQSISCHATGTGDVAYQWQKYNGSAWANVITQKGRSINFANIAYSDSGRYRCIATSSAVKDTSAEALISVTAPASVKDQALVKVNVSPNPFNDKIALAGLPTTTQVTLRDLSGRIVFTTEVSGSEVVLNIPENIVSGVYYLQLSALGEVYTAKLLKK